MSARDGDRPYKVVYSSRRREEIDDSTPSRRPRRELEYEDDYRRERVYSRGSRDDRVEGDRQSRTSDSRNVLPAAGTTKTRYAVGRDRNAEAYVKRSDAVIVEDRPSDHGRYEYEVLRPQKRDDGTYVVDIGGGGGGYSQDYAIDFDSRQPRLRRDAPPPSRRDDILYEGHRGGGRDRTVRDVAYRDVHVTEEIDDTRYSGRGRAYEAYAEDIPPPRRLKSAMRGGNSSPPALHRRASVGFYRDQISNHDASESRHERPGAEAHLAGRYLQGNGLADDDVYAAGYTRRNRSRSRSRGRYGPQRSDPRLHEYDEVDEERRTFTEQTMRQYEYEDDQRPAYPPQRATSRRRHQRHHRDDDDRSSQFETELVKRTTKEYYR
ncbi:hypothetical protein G647_00912 [Cladophialophora carrionii CBS 160.54]|uniref:Uncharacterized protein n=1 Tax=Cladophialophora carrionii CBS 160.54 TaxID=1279043 RepID=V9DQ85_9EURO|nr:uncharacterized protein G647_00912 [Cladophialophora carrionii CBS 160.54]ETI28463.1 hypothetical protein G647_00912 [Cladophialophora carrionii CBS 160.54]